MALVMFRKGVELPKSEFLNLRETPFYCKTQYSGPVFVGGFVNGELWVIEDPEYLCKSVGSDGGRKRGRDGDDPLWGWLVSF